MFHCIVDYIMGTVIFYHRSNKRNKPRDKNSEDESPSDNEETSDDEVDANQLEMSSDSDFEVTNPKKRGKKHSTSRYKHYVEFCLFFILLLV